jgi:polyferredoxin
VRRIAALLFFIALLSPVHVPLEPVPASHQPMYAQAPGAQNDPWGFEQEKTETWADILRPQALDLALLIAFITFALIGFFRKSVALKYLTLVVAVGYMGFVKSNLISIVNIFGVIDWNLPIVKYNLVWYVFAIFTVISTVLWGRLYCGRICAFGALTQLMDAVLPKKLRVEPPAWIERRAAWVKYGILATVVVRNLYCRFLCPVGAALGLLSNLTVFRIKRWSECNTCKICEKTCEWGAIQGPKIIKSECVRCDDCERLYLDQKKCPHWIIILRKADKSRKTDKLEPSPART